MISVGMNDDKVPVPMKWTDLGGKIWQRAFMGGARRQDVARFVDMYVDGTINLDGIVSHRIAIDEINHGFDLMRKGKSSRAVVIYD